MVNLTEYLLRELDNSSKPNQIKAKGTPPEKTLLLKKELPTLSLGDVTEGSDEVCEDDDEQEPFEPITSPCDSVSGY
jgi:hypothetical protein